MTTTHKNAPTRPVIRLLAPEAAWALREWRVEVPASRVVREAEELAFEVSSRELYGHSVRSYVYAAALGTAAEHDFDAELLAVGALLHDIGLTEAFGDPSRAFELASADVAAALVERHDWGLTRRYTMHRGIVLHMAPSIPPGDITEVQLLEAGISCDVTGGRRQDLGLRDHRDVLDVFPRHDFAAEFVATMEHQARRLPGSHAAILMQTGFPASTIAHQEWVDRLLTDRS